MSPPRLGSHARACPCRRVSSSRSDLEASARTRETGWLPSFGQDSAAQRHLEQQAWGSMICSCSSAGSAKSSSIEGGIGTARTCQTCTYCSDGCASVKSCTSARILFPAGFRVILMRFATAFRQHRIRVKGSTAPAHSRRSDLRSCNEAGKPRSIWRLLRLHAPIQTGADVSRISRALDRRSRWMSASQRGTGTGIRAEPGALSWSATVGRGDGEAVQLIRCRPRNFFVRGSTPTQRRRAAEVILCGRVRGPASTHRLRASRRTRKRNATNTKAKDREALVFVAFRFLVWAACAAHEVDARSAALRRRYQLPSVSGQRPLLLFACARLAICDQTAPVLICPFDNVVHVVFQQVPLLHQVARRRRHESEITVAAWIALFD